jgi:hypothetical protein
MSFFSKSNARDLKKNIYINPTNGKQKIYLCEKVTSAKLLAIQYLASQLEQPCGL